MKTLAEKLDDLKAKLKKAKTDEERKPILDGIDEIIADATKVNESLTKANAEAKESREKSETLQTEVDDLNAELKTAKSSKEKSETLQVEIDNLKAELTQAKTEEERKIILDKLDGIIKNIGANKSKESEEMPAWAKTLSENVNKIMMKDTTEAKTLLINKALKEENLPESLSKFIIIEGDDKEEIKKAVENFKQTMNDEKLLNISDPKTGEQTEVESELITNYAKGKNDPAKGASISGKDIKME